MPVVINEFEVVSDPSVHPPEPTPSPAPAEPARLPRIELERALRDLSVRLERVRAD